MRSPLTLADLCKQKPQVRDVQQEGGADGHRMPLRAGVLRLAPLPGGAQLHLRLQGPFLFILLGVVG